MVTNVGMSASKPTDPFECPFCAGLLRIAKWPQDDAGWWARLRAWRAECDAIAARLRAILDGAGV